MKLRTLPDYLFPRPRLLIVGLNPGTYSAQVGHYYARKTNRFWPLLHRSGLVPIPLTCNDDAQLPVHGIAITDLCKRVSGGVDALSLADFRRGATRIRRLLRELGPGVVVFNGLAGYRAAFHAKAKVGQQPSALEGVPTFVTASTSPRVATWTLDQLLDGWIEVRRAVDAAATSRTAPGRSPSGYRSP